MAQLEQGAAQGQAGNAGAEDGDLHAVGGWRGGQREYAQENERDCGRAAENEMGRVLRRVPAIGRRNRRQD
jgi:hypothetical protein